MHSFETPQPIWRGMALSLFGFLLYSLHDVVSKKLLLSGLHVATLAFFLSCFGITWQLLLSPYLGGLKRTFGTKNIKLHLILVVLALPALPAAIFAFANAPMSTVYAIFMCAPLLASLLSIVVLKERSHWLMWVFLLGAFSGVVLALKPGSTAFHIALLGPVYSVIASAIRNILIRSSHMHETPLSYMLFLYIGTFLVFMYPAYMVGVVPSLTQFLLIMVESMLLVSGFISVTLAIRMAPVAYTSGMQYSQIVWGILFGMLIFGNAPTWNMSAGAAIIVLCGFGLAIQSQRNRY